MDSPVQNEKIHHKLIILKDLIHDLLKYNSIEGYNNQKEFTIKIDYMGGNNLYCYYIRINRGINEPQEIFSIRFVSNKQIVEPLENFLKHFVVDENFLYSSYTKAYEKFVKYNLFLNNNVSIEYNLNNAVDFAICNKIEKNIGNKYIVKKTKNDSNRLKDEIQKDKADKTIDLMSNIITNIENYNAITNYDNKKPYKLKVKRYAENSSSGKTYTYSFDILRGTLNKENVLSLRASIHDSKVIYDKIYDLMLSFKSSKNFISDILIDDNYIGKYFLKMNNNVTLEFNFDNAYDRAFYKGFKEATDNLNIGNEAMVLKKQL